MQVNLATIILQAAPAGPAQPGAGLMPIFLMVGMFVVMYFFMIRPQSKRAKEQKKFSDSMNVGDQIVTTGGIHGRINRANDDDTLQIEISRGTFMTIHRSAVSLDMTQAHRKKIGAGVATSDTTAK